MALAKKKTNAFFLLVRAFFLLLAPFFVVRLFFVRTVGRMYGEVDKIIETLFTGVFEVADSEF